MKHLIFSALLAVSLLSTTGSAEEPSKKPAGEEKATVKEKAEVTAAGLKFSAPEGWEAVPPRNSMHQGGFTFAPKDGGDKVVTDFFHFGPGGAGGVEANLQRWKGQFQAGDGEEVKMERSKITFGEKEGTFVMLKGTYMSGPPAGQKTPMANYAMFGAIIPSDEGEIFVKLTGPEKEVTGLKEAFLKLLSSAYGQEAKLEADGKADEKPEGERKEAEAKVDEAKEKESSPKEAK